MDYQNDEMVSSGSSTDAKHYWRSLDSLLGDQGAGGGLTATGEFLDTPVREGALQESDPAYELERRDFLKIMGAGLALAGAGCTRRPVEKIMPYAQAPVEVTPGVASWYASTCQECSAHCGILVKSREGKPTKVEGNPEHPLSKGGLCARGQASVLNLYDPDRAQAPLFIEPKSGHQSEVTWSALDEKVLSFLKETRSRGGRIRLVTGPVSGSSRELVKAVVQNWGPQASHIVFESVGSEETALAQELCYGRAGALRHHFDRAQTVVSFGADFLGTWGNPVEASKAFAKSRRLSGGHGDGHGASMSQLFVFEPMLTLTGSNADQRWTVKAADQLKVALALVHEVVVTHKQGPLSSDAAFVATLSAFAPQKVAEEVGLDAQVLQKVATALVNHKGTSLVLGGGETARGDRGVALDVVAALLNSSLGNEGHTVEFAGDSVASMSSKAWGQLLSELKSGLVDTLVLVGVNPSYASAGLGFADVVKSVKNLVVLSDRLDETARFSHVFAPIHNSFETWGDAEPVEGVFSIVQPTIQPLYKTRAWQDSLLAWAPGSGGGSKDWYSYLRSQWQNRVMRAVGASGAFPSFWEKALQEGVVRSSTALKGSAPRGWKSSGWSVVSEVLKDKSPSLQLVLYSKVSVADGQNANNAWLQELPDPVTKITWNNYASISAVQAKKLGLQEGDVVSLSVGERKVELSVHVQPGVADDVVAVALGYGRERAGRVANGRGANGFAFVTMGRQVLEYSGQAVSLKKVGRVEKLATTQQHHNMEGRPIIKETTFLKYAKNPASGNEREHGAHGALPTLWSGHAYKGYRWAMAIDLSACTGCGACVIGCQAENNIPVVGPKDILNGREMHWIRIDRYHAGDAQHPETVFQPMLCQHCENAPCETVCPVLATVHDDEGLNVQAYNRCVGTRYCSNNCPYKVRRFNWHTYTAVSKPLNLQYNTEVTVRTRGVMEKCTFCTHRLLEAKGRAKDLGRKVQDGDVMTACQQSCPTDAIVFGDINDPKSRIAQVTQHNPRGYVVLEELNAKPSVTYLTKVRNATV